MRILIVIKGIRTLIIMIMIIMVDAIVNKLQSS